MAKVDLGELTKGEVRVLTGQPRGVEASKLFGLEKLEQTDGVVSVVAPDDLDTVTPSFVQGFLNAAFERLGEEGLASKYDFTALHDYLQQDFDIGIKRLKLRKEAFAI